MSYKGCVIEESLEDGAWQKILDQGNIKVLATNIEPVTERHETPWLKQWTMHDVEIAEESADIVAEQISRTIKGSDENSNDKDSWYADYKNETSHYIIFRNKVFKVDRSKSEEYEKVREYGLSIGIPEHQLPDASWVD
jgi:hypothetical protein